jgi:hypothetical protein
LSLEASGNEYSEYVFKKLCSFSVNETATQNVWQHHFLEPWGWGCCGKNWPTEVVEIATLYEFYENDRFFTTVPPVTHIWVTLSDLFTQFTIKWTQRMAWKKNA